MPKLDLPTCSGDYLSWTSFFDLFTGAVHNNGTLQNSQKLQYLKASLKGDAAKLLASVTITDANYPVAMKMLRDRYQNNRMILRAHVHAISTQKQLTNETAKDLRQLVETVEEHRLALENMGQPVHQQDIFLVYLVTEKLTADTRKFWELSTPGTGPQTYNDLKKFLETRCLALEASTLSAPTISSQHRFTSRQNNNQQSHSSQRNYNTNTTTIEINCDCCNGAHKLHLCPKFKQLSVPNRAEFVKMKKLCFNCLRAGHRQQECRGSTCKNCNLKHHTLLHLQSPRQTRSVNSTVADNNRHDESEKTNTESPPPEQFTDTSLSPQTTGTVFLQTAMMPILVNGETTLCRALLDSGSQSNLITENLVTRLGLPVEKQQVRIFGLDAKDELQHRGTTDFLITPKRAAAIPVRAFVMSKLTNILPSCKVSTSSFKHLPNLKLADPTFNTPSGIDMLIRSELFETIMLDARIKENNNVTYRDSLFGWVVIGGPPSVSIQTITTCLSSLSSIPEEETLKKFWEIEDLPQSHHFTKEEQAREQHFQLTTTRNEDGLFIVKQPFKEDAIPLGDSFQQAKRRLETLLYRLSKNESLYTRYAAFIKEFLDLGHMEKIPESEIPIATSKSFYLPHHCVLKESSTTTKLRVVFDASAKTTSGVSLNDNLMLGPKIQRDLFEILIRFRFHKVALSADIAKMYRQVLLDKEDKDFHRIL